MHNDVESQAKYSLALHGYWICTQCLETSVATGHTAQWRCHHVELQGRCQRGLLTVLRWHQHISCFSRPR